MPARRYGTAPDKLYCSWMVYGADHVKHFHTDEGPELLVPCGQLQRKRHYRGSVDYLLMSEFPTMERRTP